MSHAVAPTGPALHGLLGQFDSPDALVKAAEDWAREMKCEVMRLELLTPRTWSHPSKEFLKSWYSRIGYEPRFTEPLEKLHPDKVSELATECDFTVWQKRL